MEDINLRTLIEEDVLDSIIKIDRTSGRTLIQVNPKETEHLGLVSDGDPVQVFLATLSDVHVLNLEKIEGYIPKDATPYKERAYPIPGIFDLLEEHPEAIAYSIIPFSGRLTKSQELSEHFPTVDTDIINYYRGILHFLKVQFYN